MLAAAAAIVGDDGLAAGIESGEKTASDVKVKRLLSAYNLVIEELFGGGVREEVEEKLSSTDGKYAFGDFSFYPYAIKRVEENGRKTSYEKEKDGIRVGACEITVVYEKKPKRAKEITEDAEYGDKLGLRTLAFGVAAEALLIKGVFGEAVVMRDRFEEGVSDYFTSKKYPRIKGRSWS